MRFMQVVVTTHSPDILDVKWIKDRHLRTVNWHEGKTQIGGVSPDVRRALDQNLMGAGELLRANALTSADLFVRDPRQLALFSEGELT